MTLYLDGKPLPLAEATRALERVIARDTARLAAIRTWNYDRTEFREQDAGEALLRRLREITEGENDDQ